MVLEVLASKSFGFAAKISHIKQNHVPATKDRISRVEVQPIMFLSRCLNDVERNYWPTESEVAGIVWVVEKTGQILESKRGTSSS